MLSKIFRFLKNICILLLVAGMGFGLRTYLFDFPTRDLIHPIVYRLFGDKTYFTSLILKEKLYTPRDISKWLLENITYASDIELYNKIEFWQTPIETISKKAGDCEDFAFLTQELLNQIGITSEVVAMESLEFGHAICVYKWGNDYYIFDDGHLWKAKDGINNIESIINTEGIDMIFVGMDDIKVNLGFDIGQPTFENDKLVKILETLSEKVNKAGKYAGCVAVNADAAKRSIDLGYRFLACSVDLLLLQEASNAKLREIRTAID